MALNNQRIFDNCCILATKLFEGDVDRAMNWFAKSNPLLNNIAPIQLHVQGDTRKLLTFIKGCLEEKQNENT